METKVGKFTFKVPEGHEEAGKKIEKSFDFEQVTTEAEASEVITSKKWNVVDMVNETLKSNARANAYQTATAAYRPSTVPQEDIVERMVRDYIRIGLSEDVARKTIAGLLAAKTAE